MGRNYLDINNGIHPNKENAIEEYQQGEYTSKGLHGSEYEEQEQEVNLDNNFNNKGNIFMNKKTKNNTTESNKDVYSSSEDSENPTAHTRIALHRPPRQETTPTQRTSFLQRRR